MTPPDLVPSRGCPAPRRTIALRSRHCISPRRPDVLVEPKKIGGIVFVLQRDEPLIFFGAICGLDPFGSFIGLRAQIVNVHAAGRAWLHGFPELARPPDAGLCRARVSALTNAHETVLQVPVIERSFLAIDTAHRATQLMFDQAVAHRRRPGGAIADDDVYDLVADLRDEAGFPIVLEP